MKKYNWLISSPVQSMEGYSPPLFPKLDYDAEYTARLLESVNTAIFRFPAMGYLALHQTGDFPMHPELGRRDLLKETIAACHKRDIKVVCYVPVSHPFLPIDSKEKPWTNWLAVDHRGKRWGWWHFGYHECASVCINTPYWEAIHRIVDNLVTNYELDGVYFDGPYFAIGCCCRHCRKRYKEERGRDIPQLSTAEIWNTAADWNSPSIRVYHGWITERVENLLKSLNQVIKTRREIPHIFNNVNWFDRWVGLNRHKVVDAFLWEESKGVVGSLETAMLGRSVGKPIWCYVSGHNTGSMEHLIGGDGRWGGFRTSLPVDGEEIMMQAYTIMVGGGTPLYSQISHVYYKPDALCYIKDPFRFAKSNSRLLESARNVDFVGIAVSGHTCLWYRYDLPAIAHHFYHQGAFMALKEAHHQVSPFYAEDMSLEVLQRYSAIFLPNWACMSEKHADMLKEYVSKGGNIIATLETSLYDEEGNRRSDFLLSDLFGVNAIGGRCRLTDLGFRIVKQHPVTRGFRVGEVAPNDYLFLPVKVKKGRMVLAENFQRGAEGAVGPCVVVGDFGRGRVVYISSGLDAVYQTTRFSQVRQILDNAVRWLARTPLPYKLQAPFGVYANLIKWDKGLALHLLADVGNKNKHLYTRENYVPVRDVVARVHIENNHQVKRVRLLKSKREVAWHMKGRWVEIPLPEFVMYECVAIDM